MGDNDMEALLREVDGVLDDAVLTITRIGLIEHKVALHAILRSSIAVLLAHNPDLKTIHNESGNPSNEYTDS